MPTTAVGTFFRDVVIDPDLKDLVNTILLASSPDEPAVLAAEKRIRAMATRDRCYLFASEIRGYLEEKTRLGTEPRVFPLAGDLFLDALEATVFSLGPNLFRDHYSGMLGCYRAGDCPGKAVQGAFYCIDLVLQRTLGLFLVKDAETKAEGAHLSFHTDEDSDYRRRITLFLNLGRQCLQDAVEATVRMGTANAAPSFLNFVVEHKDRMQTVLGRWDAYHKDPDLPDLTNEQYLEGAAGVAEEAAYAPLAATIKEHQVLLREQAGVQADGKTDLEQKVHPLYGAAVMYLSQGNKDRDAEAYDLAFRRYSKAVALFTKIQDRSSAARALVERARALMKSGQDPEAVQKDLHKAASLVMARIKNLPRGTVPSATHAMALRYLKKKGYLIEAKAYAATLDGMSPSSSHLREGRKP